jgi:hypothetical protein
VVHFNGGSPSRLSRWTSDPHPNRPCSNGVLFSSPHIRAHSAHFCTFPVAVNRCRVCIRAMWRCNGDKRSDPPCIASRAMAWGFWLELSSQACFAFRRRRTWRSNTSSDLALSGPSFKRCLCATCRRLFHPRPVPDIHSGISFDERVDGRHGAGHDHPDGQYSGK